MPRVPIYWWGPKSPNNVNKYFRQYSEFAPKRPYVRIWGAKLASWPGRHRTSLSPWSCVSQKEKRRRASLKDEIDGSRQKKWGQQRLLSRHHPNNNSLQESGSLRRRTCTLTSHVTAYQHPQSCISQGGMFCATWNLHVTRRVVNSILVKRTWPRSLRVLRGIANHQGFRRHKGKICSAKKNGRDWLLTAFPVRVFLGSYLKKMRIALFATLV